MDYDNIQTFIREMHSSLDSIQELIVEKYLDENLQLNCESIKEIRNLYTDEIEILNLIVSKLNKIQSYDDKSIKQGLELVSNPTDPRINLKYHLFDKLFIKGYVSDHNDKLNLHEWANITGSVKLYWCGNLRLNVDGLEYLIVGIRTDFCWKFLLFDITSDKEYCKYIIDILLSITPQSNVDDIQIIYNDLTTYSLEGYIQKKILKWHPVKGYVEIHFLNPGARDKEEDAEHAKDRDMEEYYFNSISKSFDAALQRGQGCGINNNPPTPVSKIDYSKFSFVISGLNQLEDENDILVYKTKNINGPELNISLFINKSTKGLIFIRHFMSTKCFAIIQCILNDENSDEYDPKTFIVISSRFSELCVKLKELKNNIDNIKSSKNSKSLDSNEFYRLMKSDNVEMFELYSVNSRTNSYPALSDMCCLIELANDEKPYNMNDIEAIKSSPLSTFIEMFEG